MAAGKSTEQHGIVSAVDSAYARLLQQILSGKREPGQKLAEETLCKEFQISRTPIREALLRLEYEGLVERRPRYGCRVKGFRQEDIADLFQCRAILETQALALGFDHLDQNAIEQMLQQLKQIRQENDDSESAKSVQIDTAMHAMIAAECPNKTLRELLFDLQRKTSAFRNARAYGGQLLSIANKERQKILQAIHEKKLQDAQKLLFTHICAGIEGLPAGQ